MALYIYNFLMLAVLIVGFPVVLPFLVTSRKRRKTVLQRLFFGFNRETRPAWRGKAGQATIWVHALSLGEVVSAVPLVLALEKIFGKEKLVFSVSTLTGYETAVHRLEPHVRRVFFFPYDILFTVIRAVNRVSPDLVIIVETDLWPNFMARLKLKAIPALLVNARLSDRSTTGYRRIPRIVKPLLNAFATLCVQSREDADRFITIGARPERVRVTGNFKFDQPVPPMSSREEETLRRTFHLQAGDRVIVAGSTHPGEEGPLLEGVVRLKARWPELKLVIAPRDPERAAEVKSLSVARGLKAGCLGGLEKENTTGALDVIVIDRIGILGRTYALGDLAFVGGSLVTAGGHNPLEAAAFGKPVLFGPDMSDFRQVARRLVAGGGAVTVADTDSFTEQVQRLLANAELARSTGRCALRIFTANSGAVQRTLAQVRSIPGWTGVKNQ
jgi:3-deoxy-D-manno-octulosonic-acid transferase